MATAGRDLGWDVKSTFRKKTQGDGLLEPQVRELCLLLSYPDYMKAGRQTVDCRNFADLLATTQPSIRRALLSPPDESNIRPCVSGCRVRALSRCRVPAGLLHGWDGRLPRPTRLLCAADGFHDADRVQPRSLYPGVASCLLARATTSPLRLPRVRHPRRQAAMWVRPGRVLRRLAIRASTRRSRE